MIKTNAMRLLDIAKITYKFYEYEVKEDNSLGVDVANRLGVSADVVFKTLVTKGDKNGVNVFCIPINCELNLKKAASVSGNKKLEMVAMKDILSLTGYVRGACSPIGMKKKYPTYIDIKATNFDEIGISAGAKGCELVLNPNELLWYVEGSFVDAT